jgi:hypothetical protein
MIDSKSVCLHPAQYEDTEVREQCEQIMRLDLPAGAKELDMTWKLLVAADGSPGNERWLGRLEYKKEGK